MKIRSLIASLLALALAFTLPAFSLAEESTAAAETQENGKTLEQMLTLAIEDEYLAQATYDAVIGKFNVIRPFANIVRAEGNHIAALTKLFTAYGFALPENTASAKVTLPETLAEVLTLEIQAEEKNIAMYVEFLSQMDLPDDVKTVFGALKSASENHLKAYTRIAEKTMPGTAYGYRGNKFGTEDGTQEGKMPYGNRGNMKGSGRDGMYGRGYGAQDDNVPGCGMGGRMQRRNDSNSRHGGMGGRGYRNGNQTYPNNSGCPCLTQGN